MQTIPVNEHGEVDIRKGVPEGLVHIHVLRAGPTCIAKDIPYGKALVGYRYINGASRSMYKGIVILPEDETRLREALEARKPAQEARVKEWEHKKIQIAEKIRKRFPGMPVSEENIIVEHAWKKRSGRVGRKLPIEEAIMPAVIARIRHNHTNYDRLRISYRYDSGIYGHEDYKELARDKARQRVSGQITEILYKWETNGGYDLKEIVFRNIQCHGKSTFEEIIFRFELRTANEVNDALNALLLDGKIVKDSDVYYSLESIAPVQEIKEENIEAIAA